MLNMLLKSIIKHFTHKNIYRDQWMRINKYKTRKQDPPLPKSSPEVMAFVENLDEYKELKEFMPKFLFKKSKTIQNTYLLSRDTAKRIVDELELLLKDSNPIIEVNPGMGVLSEELLKRLKSDIYMFEASPLFKHFEREISLKYPGRVHYKEADFFSMYKLAYQDRIDDGSRIKDLLGDLATIDHSRTMKIVGAMPGVKFLTHMMYNIVFNKASSSLGRPDLYIAIPAISLKAITTHSKTKKFRSMQLLFKLVFEIRMLCTVPKSHYLPWQDASKDEEGEEANQMYIVNIVQKEKPPCNIEDLPLLWYFLKHISKTTRVIPFLEQWIPGCGVWLITEQDPPETRRHLAPGADDAPLPHLTIFTQFGDLTLHQRLTVFKKFISWPEFEQCPFRVSMETHLPKGEVNPGDTDDKTRIVGTAIDDPEPLSDIEDEVK